MPLARTQAVSLLGVSGHLVEVEADIGSTIPAIVLVGLPDAAVSEARDRVRAAITNSGEGWPQRRITVGLSPAALPKRGSGFDLAIAVAVLAANGAVQLASIADTVFLGELGLDGRVRTVRGVLPAVVAAVDAGWTKVVVPSPNADEARLVPGADVYGVGSLRVLLAWLRGDVDREALQAAEDSERLAESSPGAAAERLAAEHDLDVADVRGQPEARYALEVAAAGGHHLLLDGPPGTGKSMLAQRLPGILPVLSRQDALEVTSIHSVAGALPPDSPLVERPPFQDPHHSASVAAILGGGSGASRPGAVSLAHRGILLLDEAPEFTPALLEGLREPMERGEIVIARAAATVRFPARFQLVLTANPCPCGLAVGLGASCRCTPAQRLRYAARLSGPVVDRVDIRQTLGQPTRAALAVDQPETSALIGSRVQAARARQALRYAGTGWRTNSDIAGPRLRRDHPPDGSALALLEERLRAGWLTARGADRTLRVAWSIADLNGAARPGLDEMHTGARSAWHEPGGRMTTVMELLGPVGEDPDRWARVALARVAESGDRRLAKLVAERGPVRTLAAVADGTLPLTWVERYRARLGVVDLLTLRGLADDVDARVVIPDDDEWPQCLDDLAQLEDANSGPPLALWLRGPLRLEEVVTRSVAVVGARAATAYGREVATQLGYELAERGVTVVSGAAYGIDGAAHRGALAAGGRTVAVLACGIDRAYPAGHDRLIAQIASEGLVVSESAPGTPPNRARFLTRNRLIAGLSDGTVVVEAAIRSGSLNTVSWAAKLSRQTMAVPGPVTSPLSAGVHRQVIDKDARLVTDAADVLELVCPVGESMQAPRRAPESARDLLPPAAAAVLEALPTRAARDAGELAVAAGVSIGVAMAALGQLHTEGWVVRVRNGWQRAPSRPRAAASGPA